MMNDRELAAVLAGLRLLQQAEGRPWPCDCLYDGAIDEIATCGGEYKDPIGSAEIDALCERLNTAPASLKTYRIVAQISMERKFTSRAKAHEAARQLYLNVANNHGVAVWGQVHDSDGAEFRWNLSTDAFSETLKPPKPNVEPIDIGHPLPIGTWIESIAGEQDADGNDEERHTGPNAIGWIIDMHEYDMGYRTTFPSAGWFNYSVVFPNGTWVWLDDNDLDDRTKYLVLTPD